MDSECPASTVTEDASLKVSKFPLGSKTFSLLFRLVKRGSDYELVSITKLETSSKFYLSPFSKLYQSVKTLFPY